MEHPYGLLSLLPPVVAIALAIITRHAVLSLLAGLACGSLLTSGGDLYRAAYDLLEVHLWPTIIDPSKLRIFSFTLLMGGLIGLIIRSGGMQGLVRLIAPLASNRRSGQLTTWLMGMAIFFDDYANSLLIGNTFKPVCDRLKISREKLAYIVDTTAAPVAGLSLLSTWVAVELEFIDQGIGAIGGTTNLAAIELFIDSIPYRFYVLGALFLVPLIAWTGRDFGPMWVAESKRANHPGEPDPSGSWLQTEVAEELDVPTQGSHWLNALLPIAVTLGVVILLILKTGSAALAKRAGADTNPPLREIIGAADSSIALQYGSLAGLIVAMLMYRAQGLMDLAEMARAIRRGAGLVIPAIAILWFASALSRMTSDRPVDSSREVAQGPANDPYPHRDHRLYTGAFLGQLIAHQANGEGGANGDGGAGWTLKLLPTIIFVLASIVSFCTGTSFGTMGMLTPLVLPLAYRMIAEQGGAVSADNPLLLASLGGVLAGAIFGDHCSPISDTTIMSSQASGCDVMAHTLTQLPYALLVGGVAILLGTLPAGWGVSPLLLVPLQFAALVLVMRRFGKRVEGV
jgi:Na+/H+ antiporter NhaC